MNLDELSKRLKSDAADLLESINEYDYSRASQLTRAHDRMIWAAEILDAVSSVSNN